MGRYSWVFECYYRWVYFVLVFFEDVGYEILSESDFGDGCFLGIVI